MTPMSASLFGLSLLSAALAFGCSSQVDATDSNVETQESHLDFDPYHDYYDGPGQRTYTQTEVGGITMHTCPPGYVMIGAHVSDNVFRCILTRSVGTPQLDTGTQRDGMHACPANMTMVGLHAELNYLACAYAGAFYEGSSNGAPENQDKYPMHTCWQNYAMTGINIGENRFLCAF